MDHRHLACVLMLIVENVACSSTAGCEPTRYKSTVPLSEGGLDSTHMDAGRDLPSEICTSHCASPESCRLVETDAGNPAIECTEIAYCEGRRPPGLCPPALPRRSILGDYFARAAHLEGASVVAFQRLHRELASLGAPKRLLRSVARARREEVRHRRIMSAWAYQYGASVPAVITTSQSLRSLDTIAADNAIEGCVRETYGTTVKLWQATHARKHQLRDSLSKIAWDEARHAALSWDLAQWTEERLNATAKQRIAALRNRAIDELATQARVRPDPMLVSEVGIPETDAALRLVAGLARWLAVA